MYLDLVRSCRVVIYHRGCTDGFCAAWIARKVWEDAAFIPAMYGEDPVYRDALAGKDVLMVDFSLPRQILLDIKSKAKSLLVLDHHQTAQADLDGLDFCIFDMQKSGATLALDWATSQGYVPHPDIVKLAQYVEDRDLWKFHLPHSHHISIAMRSYPMDFKTWDQLYGDGPIDWDELVRDGRVICRYRDQLIDQHVAKAHYVTFKVDDTHSYDVLVCECSCTDIISEVASSLATGRPFGACYYISGEKIIFSLRSLPPDGVDVSAVARKFGGGGHRHAAGFSIPVKYRIWLQYMIDGREWRLSGV